MCWLVDFLLVTVADVNLADVLLQADCFPPTADRPGPLESASLHRVLVFESRKTRHDFRNFIDSRLAKSNICKKHERLMASERVVAERVAVTASAAVSESPLVSANLA